MDLTIIWSITEALHLPPESRFTVYDPIMNLLDGMLRSVLAGAQGWRAEFIGVALSLCAVTARTNTIVDLIPVFDEGWADRLQKWR